MRPVLFEKSVQLASSVDDVWPLVIDTDRVNRLLGLESVKFKPYDDPQGRGARYLAETTIAGFASVYEELPFEWAHKREFSVRRRFLKGPVEWLELRTKLSPGRPDLGGFEGGSTLTMRFEAVPKNALFFPIAWIGGRQAVGDLLELGSAIDAYVQGKGANPMSQPVGASDRDLIERGVRELAERIGRDLADRIGKTLADAPDADLVRMRPFEIADSWSLDRRKVLTAFLHAVPSGLLELRWSIVCPSCRTSSAQVDALEDVPLEGHCQLCDIAFDLDLDRAVEATFVPHGAVRTVPPMMFCIGGPARTPHVLSQVLVPARGAANLAVPSTDGRYRLFARGGARATVVVAQGAEDEVRVTYRDDKLAPAELKVVPGSTLVVENTGDDTRHVKLERLEYASAAATAHDLAMVPEFRTLFSGQLLKRGTPLKVSRTAILFTDLTGSTALYNTVGDAAAFRLVDDHFDVLRAAVGAAGGTIVKTMGDAVMASFPDPASCMRGAVECLERFIAFRDQQQHGALIHLKLGMFAGACYVVTANGTLDYFGQTVNVASRLQHLAASGEIVVEEKELDALPKDVRERLRFSEPFETRVKGVDRALHVVRAELTSTST